MSSNVLSRRHFVSAAGTMIGGWYAAAQGRYADAVRR
jgi:hypothetical protein